MKKNILDFKFKYFIILFVTYLLTGCYGFFSDTVDIPSEKNGKYVYIETTGYCSCQKCCGWTRNWLFQPVYAYGPNKGKPKKVGYCADGTKAKRGTIAADTRYFPMGTRMYIPGYGTGVVHDRGGAIKGAKRLDLFFETHQDALNWGRRKVKVFIYNR